MMVVFIYIDNNVQSTIKLLDKALLIGRYFQTNCTFDLNG
jgi:hypothetical protein